LLSGSLLSSVYENKPDKFCIIVCIESIDHTPLKLIFLKQKLKDRSQWANLWLRYRSGDLSAFTEIYEEFVDVLFAYGSKITHDRELLKDCIHDLFYNLHRYNPVLHHPEYLEFYLFRSLKNLIIQRVKKGKFESSLDDKSLSKFELMFNVEQDNFDLELDEIRLKALRKILNTLDPLKRELLFLKFYTGLNYPEIGQLLKMNPDTVKKQIYRTLEHLRGKFGKKLIDLLVVAVHK